ncbi:chemotaxis signal transduction protein [Thiorhodovibrio frisius]|uniref:Chemotaxis protein CheW n=1 Tax=Thiorhodovibrio frisius TaxID=631362 RepID=H8YYR4_9GAMM|nr:chemotaxis signal transduction protein [Thiorhodovibrio frisius]WPL23323.1 Chemotaxis protein CheW [Thiorhodovibrio frisius]
MTIETPPPEMRPEKVGPEQIEPEQIEPETLTENPKDSPPKSRQGQSKQGRDGVPLDDDLDEQVSDIRQFVTFVVGEEVFAVDMAPVQEIIRVPEVVRVPLAPPSLQGLANLRGKVLPIIALRHLFGLPEREHDDTTRALVIDIGQPLGFVVDRVASVIGVEPAKIEAVGSISSTVDTQLLSGLIKDVGGHAMIMVLDFAQLISREFADIAKLAKSAGMTAGLSRQAETEEEEDSDELQLVSFDVAGQEYAVAIENVQEIVQVPEHIVQVPRSEQHVLGVMSLRNRLLPLVSLRRMFALPPQEADEHSRIVVVSLGGTSVGLVMDSVNEVLRVAKAVVEAMPGLLARDGDMADISDICRLDEGKRLVSIISTDNLFRHSAIKEALTTVDSMNESERADVEDSDEESADDDEQVVVFRLDKEEFGVPIESVQEIVRVPEELTHVPKAPAFVEGVINLRGTVLPVIDLRRRLGLQSVERTDRQRVMVFLIEGARTGFIVDSVAEVLKIPKTAIEPAPQLSSEQSQLLARMANLEKQQRLVQLIDPTQLVRGRELADLAALSA